MDFLLTLIILISTSAIVHSRTTFLNQDVRTIIQGSNELGVKLLKNVSHETNIFFSPISISMLIGLVYSGASHKAAEELRNVLQFPYNVSHAFKNILELIKPLEGKTANPASYQLEMANAVLLDKQFNILPAYKEQSKEFFDAAVESVSFSLYPEAATESVNGWVAWKTKNKIPKVLQELLDPLTKLFLMNIVYFKGTWKTKFDQRLTMPDTFYNNGLVPKTVPMMRLKRKLRYGFDSRLQSHVLELPYLGNRVQMLLLLPERRDGLPEMESALSLGNFHEVTRSLREVPVQVTLPRFSLSEEYDLIPILQQLGVREIFDADAGGLSGITPRQGLHVTKMVHKCAVLVNEEGGEAAAVTGVAAGVRTGGPLVPLFTADHPFLFVVQDKQLNATLFIGRITQL